MIRQNLRELQVDNRKLLRKISELQIHIFDSQGSEEKLKTSHREEEMRRGDREGDDIF